MPRTDLLDELGIYLTEKKNNQARWTSLRDISEAIAKGIDEYHMSERMKACMAVFGEREQDAYQQAQNDSVDSWKAAAKASAKENGNEHPGRPANHDRQHPGSQTRVEPAISLQSRIQSPANETEQ